MSAKAVLMAGLVAAYMGLSVSARAQESAAETPSGEGTVDVGSSEPIVIPSETQRQPPVVVAPPVQTTIVEAPSATNDDDPWHVRQAYHPDMQTSEDSSKLAIGLTMDLGVPSGATLRLAVSPFLPWLTANIGGGYNGLGGGIVGGIELNPINFPIAPILSLDLGDFMPGKFPGVSKSPSIGYTFEDVMLGVAIGKRSGFTFVLEGGVAHLDAQATNFQGTFTLPTGTTLNNVDMNVFVPAAKLGFTLMF